MKKNFTININTSIFWKVIIPGCLIAMSVGIIGGILLIDKVIMPNIVGVQRDIVTVPSVTGMQLESGKETFYKAGLLTEIRNREYDDKIQEGSIISQFPEAGSKVKKNRRIAIVVSKGKEIGIIPDVRNLTERQARIELKKKGFTIGKIKKVYDEEKPLDVIINAFPECGTKISRAMDVDLILSKGPKPTSAEVPNLVGESIAEAKKKIEESGLAIGSISYQNNPSLLPGTIVSQSESPGSKIPLDSKINLVVSVIR
jgi:serine/threonine-protein kinase